METLRCAVIGAGWWATSAHLPALASHPRAQTMAVQCRDREKAERIAREFRVRRACTTVAEVLDGGDVDAVIISSTPNVHFAQAKACLERGLHVLIEKPMTFTDAEAAELCVLAEKAGAELLISCPWHFTRHGIAARDLIRSGRLGEVRMISVLMTNPIDKLLKGINTSPTHGQEHVMVEPRPGSYSDPAIAGGGQIYCQVSHAAAYLSFLTGETPSDVFARFENDGSVNDIYDALVVRLSGGALCTIASTGATPLALRQYEVRVFGTAGVLVLELWQGTMKFVPMEGEVEEFAPLAPDEVYPAMAPAWNLVDAALGLAPNQSPGRLGLAAMEVISAAVESARSGRNVAILPKT